MNNEKDPKVEFPEADRLEGFAHPRMVSEFFGNCSAEQALLEAFSANRLHHAWLFSGLEGVGKATLAYRFARFLLAQDSDVSRPDDLSIERDHPVFSQIGALSHPNLLVLRRPWQADKKRLATAITISEARKLKRFFAHTAGAGQWRVVIIDRADELNAAAANALLKNLEEPPARCVFLLVCSAPGRLPVTIRSRCRTLGFAPLAEGEFESAVLSAYEAAGLEPPQAESVSVCMALAQGSVGRALHLLERGGNEMHARLVKLMESLPELDHEAVHKLADEISASGAQGSYELFFDLTGETLARVVGHAATGQGALGREVHLAERMNDTRALAQMAQLWETIQRAKVEADALNLDRKNLVLGTFFRLEDTARQALR
jgi:DNA polymerase-3 subunit delta'